MLDNFETIRLQIIRQIEHWTTAATHLLSLDDFASPEAWNGLEKYLGLIIKKRLLESIERLLREFDSIRSQIVTLQTQSDLQEIQKRILLLRQKYLQTEMTVDFLCDAINTRTNPEIASLLRACDYLSTRSMNLFLSQLGKNTPPVLTYIDKGLGASILKEGLQLWDSKTFNPAAVIKVVWHNMLRLTSLIHEAGHQVAQIIGWNTELLNKLEMNIPAQNKELVRIWMNWSSEMAADAFAFVHTGYASVAALHDVLAGDDSFVFRFDGIDPHPISYLRVLLGVEMCRLAYGSGPWDGLAIAWMSTHDYRLCDIPTRAIITDSLPILPLISKILLTLEMRCFSNRSLANIINMQAVSPKNLGEMEIKYGKALYTSQHLVLQESLRILALTGLQMAILPTSSIEYVSKQKGWIMLLGKIFDVLII
jgi:hypothetical protein